MEVPEKIAAIRKWERCSENSELFQRIAASIDAEFGREQVMRFSTSQTMPDNEGDENLYNTDSEAYEETDSVEESDNEATESDDSEADEYEDDFVVDDSVVEYDSAYSVQSTDGSTCSETSEESSDSDDPDLSTDDNLDGEQDAPEDLQTE